VEKVDAQWLVTLVLTFSVLCCGTGIVVLMMDVGAVPSALCGCIGTTGLLLSDVVGKRRR